MWKRLYVRAGEEVKQELGESRPFVATRDIRALLAGVA